MAVRPTCALTDCRLFHLCRTPTGGFWLIVWMESRDSSDHWPCYQAMQGGYQLNHIKGVEGANALKCQLINLFNSSSGVSYIVTAGTASMQDSPGTHIYVDTASLPPHDCLVRGQTGSFSPHRTVCLQTSPVQQWSSSNPAQCKWPWATK